MVGWYGHDKAPAACFPRLCSFSQSSAYTRVSQGFLIRTPACRAYNPLQVCRKCTHILRRIHQHFCMTTFPRNTSVPLRCERSHAGGMWKRFF
jgi:hypothetical protein